MTQILNLILLPLSASFIVSGLVAKLTIAFYTKKKWLDDPKKQSHEKIVHTKAVPRGGGIPIFIALILSSLFFLTINKNLIGILLGSLVLTIVGVADDILDLSPYTRLVTGTLAALFVVASGIGIAYVTNPFGPAGSVLSLSSPQIAFDLLGQTRTVWILSDIFALIWITWLMNIVNWSKGVDGQMPGFVAIAALFIGLLSLRFAGDASQSNAIGLAAITSGAFFGLLLFNRYPQKIMPGYGGGSLGGFLLAVLAILSGAKVAAMILILGVPIVDALITIFRRLVSGRSPVWGDRGHLHHRLLDIGWSKSSVARFYWLTTFLFGVFALQLNSTQKLFTIITTALLVFGLVIWLKLAQTSITTKK